MQWIFLSSRFFFQKTSRPWGVSVHQAVQNSPLQPSVLVPWRASCRQPRWVDDGMVVSVWLKLNLGQRCLLQSFVLVGEKWASNWYDYTLYLWFELHIYFPVIFVPYDFFSPIKNSMTPICWCYPEVNSVATGQRVWCWSDRRWSHPMRLGQLWWIA